VIRLKFYDVLIKNLTKENFAPYGQLFEIQTGEGASCITERFNFWPRLATFRCERGEVQIGISTFLKRPFRLCSMERHLTSEEVMIPLTGSVVIAFAAEDGADPEELPDAGRVEAFLIPPAKGIVVKRNVWHWTPMPLEDQTSIICMFETGTEMTDVLIRNFPGEDIVGIKLSD
jgi:ureidoglycolate hydrolase